MLEGHNSGGKTRWGKSFSKSITIIVWGRKRLGDSQYGNYNMQNPLKSVLFVHDFKTKNKTKHH